MNSTASYVSDSDAAGPEIRRIKERGEDGDIHTHTHSLIFTHTGKSEAYCGSLSI